MDRVERPTLKILVFIFAVRDESWSLKKTIPSNTLCKITFHAKSISGSRRLRISRPCGGGGCEPVIISDKWQKYSVTFISKYATPGFFFAITDHYGRYNYLEEGEFLLDDMEIKPVQANTE